MKIIIIDIETTGFLNQGGAIVEIGISELDTYNGDIKTIYSRVCKEDIFTNEHNSKPFGWIFNNSNLTFDEVLNGKPFEVVAAEVQAILNKYTSGVTAFNKKFDFDFLRDRGIKIKYELDCLMHSCTDICKILTKGRSNYKWPNVEEAFNHFYPRIKYNEKHRGGDDSYHEAMIALKLVKMGVIKIDNKL